MKVKLTVEFEDGTSGVVEVERLAHAHPKSILTAAEGLLVAEQNGKKVARIGWTAAHPSSPEVQRTILRDEMLTRRRVVNGLRSDKEPLDEKYQRLFV